MKSNLQIRRFDNGKLYTARSYDTCIAVFRSDGVYVFNATKYSATTTRHQNKVRAEIIANGIVPVINVPRGADIATLLNLAEGVQP
jgi:spermidine synthase